MRKLLFGILSLLIIGVVGYFLIPVKEVDGVFKPSDVFNAVPKESSYIIRGKNISNTWRDFSKTSIGKNMEDWAGSQHISNFFKLTDSLNSKSLNEVLEGELIVAGVVSGGGSINHLFLSEIDPTDLDAVKQSFELVFGKAKIEKKYEGNDILKFEKGGIAYYGAYCKPLMIWSDSEILIESSIRELKGEHHLADHPDFKKLLKTADIDLDANLFVNYSEVGRLLGLFTNDFDFQSNMKLYGGWAEVDIRSKATEIMLNGFSAINDSANLYLSSFKDELPQPLTISAVLPENLGWMNFSGMTSFDSYKKKYNAYLNKNKTLYQHQKNILNINKKHSFTVEQDFYSWIGNEMAVFSLNGDDNTFNDNVGLIFKMKDGDAAKKGLEEIHKSTGVTNEVVYENFKLNDLGLTNFFKLVLGEQFSFVKSSKYVIIEDFIIFANDDSALKHIVNSYLRGKTLVKNIQFNKFYEQFASESNVFYYINFKNSGNFFNHFLKEASLENYKSKIDSIENLQAIGLQVNQNKNLFFTNSYMNYNPSEESVNISLIEVKLDTTYSITPWIVINHYTKEKEILVQDNLNQLYLINNVGKILWKKKIGEQIIGNVIQVDRYKNDKLQYTFTTKKTLHQIDRNGNHVSGYPVKIAGNVTQGVAVMDYDKNRNYRILVTQGKSIINYGIDGKKVSGWDFKSKGEIQVAPELLQVNRKDYIVFADDQGNVRVLNRRGEDRIKLATSLPKSKGKYHIWLNSSLATSGVFTNDTNGTIHFVRLSDGLETFSCKVFDDSFRWTYQDFDGDGVLDFIAEEKNSITVFKNNKKRVAEIKDLANYSAFGLQSFNFGENKSVNVITNLEEGEVSCYNESGEVLPGFPIDGVTPALIEDINNDKVADLIIGDKLGSLYIYNLGK